MPAVSAFALHEIARGIAAIAASTIVLSVTPNRNTGVAPLYVHLSTLGTTSSSTSQPFHDIEYRTVCSDGSMGNWAYGPKAGTPKNVQISSVPCFVLENAGTFTLTTTGYINGVASDPVTNVIIVTAADTHFTTTPITFTGSLSGGATSATLNSAWTGAVGTGASPVTFSNGDKRFVTMTNGATTATWTGGLSGAATASATVASTVCVSATGSVTGAPSGAYVVTGSDWGAAGAGVSAITAGSTMRRLLFNKGETFTCAGLQKVLGGFNNTSRILVGAYGSGATPVLSPPASEPLGGAWLALSSTTSAAAIDVSISDVSFDAGARVDDVLTGFGAAGGIDRVTFQRVTFIGCKISISISENTPQGNNTIADAALHTPQNAAFGGHHIWDQWAVIDCSVTGASRAYTTSANLPYGIYIGCIERFFLAGNYIDVNSIDPAAQKATHVIRINYSYNSSICNNVAMRPGATRLCLKLCSSSYGARQTQSVNVGTTAVTFSSAPSGATSGTLNATWGGATGTYTVAFSNAEERQVPLTNGSASTGTWQKTLGTVTTSATVYPLITPYLMPADPANNGSGGTKYVVIADNDFIAGDTSTIPVAISPPSNDGDGRGDQIIFERNVIRSGGKVQLMLQLSWSHVSIRNNLFDFRDGFYGEGIRIIKEWKLPDPNAAIPPASGPVPDGIWIYNNSFSAPTAFNISSFWAVNFYDATPINVAIQNNLAYSPLDSGYHRMIFEQLVGGGSLAPYTATNNTSTAQCLSTSPLWSTTPPAGSTPTQWLLQSGSYGKNAGISVPVWSDFFGTVRAIGSFDMGATEQ